MERETGPSLFCIDDAKSFNLIVDGEGQRQKLLNAVRIERCK